MLASRISTAHFRQFKSYLLGRHENAISFLFIPSEDFNSRERLGLVAFQAEKIRKG